MRLCDTMKDEKALRRVVEYITACQESGYTEVTSEEISEKTGVLLETVNEIMETLKDDGLVSDIPIGSAS